MKKTKPITPTEASKNKIKYIDPLIIESVNQLLSEKFENGTININQSDIIERYYELGGNIDRNSLFENKHLDIEEVFAQSGWSVSYDKPGYNESYEAYFIFKPKRTTK